MSNCIIKIKFFFLIKDAQHTNAGDNLLKSIVACYKEASDTIVGVGVNCCSPHLVVDILKSINEDPSIPPPEILPRIVYPNAGELWVSGEG